ncbi:hypothetical protein [Mycobacteroides abscessus]|uniref:hypothetical protein n=1 Tax=Mycobacteroides abscessus TaxID=36809 RepID=UPI0013F688E9|nr:hypothetical protein [Mycobacteroides abscessus]
MADSLKVVGGRYEEMAGLIRRAVDAFVLVASALDPPTQQAALTAMVGKSMTAMGDMNSAT